MTAAEFIDALDTKKLLQPAMVEKLRKKVASSGSKPLTAKSLARFLIEKGHLSKQDVVDALAAGGEIETPPQPEPSSTGEPSGVDLPMDQLQDLSSSAEWSLEESGGGFAEPASAKGDDNISGKTKKKRKKRKAKKSNEWDSPLLLIGGSSLVLLLIIGGLIWFILFAENADNILAEARKGMQEGSYGSAIANYEKFVEEFDGNAEHSAARVELAMARIRQMLETAGPQQAFDTAEIELRAIGNEPDFNVAEENLRGLLPRIARGLADQAEASDDLDSTKALYEKASTALGMANNTKYIPKSRRDNTELEEIRETLDRISRRQQSMTDLEATLSEITTSIGSGDTAGAFSAQETLVKKHPSLISNTQLVEALEQISAAEQEGITFVDEALEASNAERTNAVIATLAVANRRIPGEAPTSGVFCAQVNGVAYGLDAANGNVLWRRYTGPAAAPYHPLAVGSDLLLIEWRANEEGAPEQALARVEAGSGKLVWRLELDDQVAAPVLMGQQVLLAGESGRLHVVDTETGARRGYVQFAQPLRTPPTVSPKRGVIYLPGDHSSIYTLSASDFSCLGVHYSNHARQSVVAPIAIVLDRVVLVDNDGAKTSRLRLFDVDTEGTITNVAAEQRLAGRVTTQPLVAGRRVTAISDRGQVDVYEVSAGSEGNPLTVLATRAARGSQPFSRYAMMLDGHIWIGENSLAKYSISPSGNRLSVVPLTDDYNRSQFVGPIDARDGVLFHTRARRRAAGYTVTACSANDGATYWSTDVGAPPAGGPLASQSPVALLESDANGQVYRFDPAAIRTRVQNTPLPKPDGERPGGAFDSATLLRGGAAVFASRGGSSPLLYSPSGSKPLARVVLPSPLASRPTPLAAGWVAPLTVGQVFFLDNQTGSPLAAPFQPPLAAGRSVVWQPASVYEGDQLILTDGVAKVYLLEAQNDGSPMLAATAEADLSIAPLTSGFVPAGNAAVALAESGEIVTIQLPTLDPGNRLDPGSRVVWGPYSTGELAVLATTNHIIAIDGEGTVAWQVPLTITKFVGAPLVQDAEMVVASQLGAIVKYNLADGSEVGRVDAGEPLDAGPVVLNNRIVVAARDASLLVVEKP